jgi:tetratricopeptide (TPR) repeat protein
LAAVMKPKLCACESGLTAERCCTLNLSRLSPTEAQRHLQPLEERAATARTEGALDEAERLALDVLELAPGRVPALSVLYELRKSQGRTKAAVALIRRIVVLAPNNFWATNEATVLLLGRGDVGEAARLARNAVRIAPEAAQAHYLMGMTLTEAHRPAVAEYHYRRAFEISGTREPVALSNFALCLKNQGKMAEARALYTEALAAAPDNLHVLMGLVRLEEADRDLAAAMTLLERAATLAPASQHVQLQRAVVLGRSGDTAGAIATLDQMATSDAPFGAGELLEKGRLLDRMEQYEEAFRTFEAGKQRLREVSGRAYLDDYARQLIERRRQFFTAKRLRTLPRARTRAEIAQPIFVLGFPRSGTTLMEQTLSAHPLITAGDELPIINEITSIMPRVLDSPLSYPDALSELWMGDHLDDLDTLRDYYLRKVDWLGIVPQGARWFTDKMPLNETDLGLIHLLFPASPLIHVIRHPLDVVVSVFSNLLTHGCFCAYALDSIAKHYVRVADLVEHYCQELPLRYLRVRYEDMVDQQEATVRQVLEFVGAEFDPRCLAFHENRRFARTASYAQVTERLYDRSRFRYRHYLPQLEPVIATLRPVIERLGYTI